MDLKSYITLKEQYVQMYTPTLSEEVEVVEEGSIDEALGTLGDALGNREDARKIGKAEVKPAQPGKASGAGALGTTGDALGGRMVSASSPNKPTPNSKAAAATPNVKPRTPNQGRVSPSKQNMAGKTAQAKPAPKSRAANLPTNLKATEKIETKKANDFRTASNNAKPPAAKPPAAKPPAAKPPATASSGPAPKPAPKNTPAPKDRMASASKSDRMAAWAKANPSLANKAKTPNPLMKKMGLNKPAASSAPKPSPAGATGSSRLAKALSGIKPMREEYTEFDLILEYLVDSGFPKEEALVVMVNMSEEKQLEILESYLTEEDADRIKDMRQERGGVDGNTDYKRPARPSNSSSTKSKEEREAASKRAFEATKAALEKQYGKGSIVSSKKK